MKSRTFVTLAVSEETYNEIYELLANAGYHHAFINCETAMDMQGIALTKKERTPQEKELSEFAKDFAKTAIKQILTQARK